MQCTFPMLIYLHLFTKCFTKNSHIWEQFAAMCDFIVLLFTDTFSFTSHVTHTFTFTCSCSLIHSHSLLMSLIHSHSLSHVTHSLSANRCISFKHLISLHCISKEIHVDPSLDEKASIHQVTTMLATSKNALFLGPNHRCWWLDDLMTCCWHFERLQRWRVISTSG